MQLGPLCFADCDSHPDGALRHQPGLILTLSGWRWGQRRRGIARGYVLALLELTLYQHRVAVIARHSVRSLPRA
jgi:hypothetical protein